MYINVKKQRKLVLHLPLSANGVISQTPAQSSEVSSKTLINTLYEMTSSLRLFLPVSQSAIKPGHVPDLLT